MWGVGEDVRGDDRREEKVVRRRAGRWAIEVATFLGMSGVAPAESTRDVVKKRGRVIAGLRNDLPLLGMSTKDGNLKGFNAEFAKAIAKKLGVELKYKLVTSSTRIPMLVSGLCADVVDGIAKAQRGRRLQHRVLLGLLGYPNDVVLKNGPIKSNDDLAAPRVTASVQGSNTAAVFLQQQPKGKIVSFQKWPQTALAAEAGESRCRSDRRPHPAGLHRCEPGISAASGDVYYRDPYAMMVRQNDSKWRNAINNAISERGEDGTYAEIFQKTRLG
jgi:polar amino acid transport system substrate-binding protein